MEALPSFNITQASGKNRATADGKRVDHNDASGGQDKLDVVPAYQPIIHTKAFIKAIQDLGMHDSLIKQLVMERGSVGMPDAYRWIPTREQDLNVNM